MTKVGTVFEISYAHRLLNHPGKCANLHGHNARIEIEVGGGINPVTGMVLDFSRLKEQVVDPVKRSLDHVTILEDKDPLSDQVPGKLRLIGCPPTAENLAEIILRTFLRSLEGMDYYTVRFWETRDCYAECSYSVYKGEVYQW